MRNIFKAVGFATLGFAAFVVLMSITTASMYQASYMYAYGRASQKVVLVLVASSSAAFLGAAGLVLAAIYPLWAMMRDESDSQVGSTD